MVTVSAIIPSYWFVWYVCIAAFPPCTVFETIATGSLSRAMLPRRGLVVKVLSRYHSH
jgi:hypothetical protein